MIGPDEIILSNCPDCLSNAVVKENFVRGIWEVCCTKCPTFVWHNTKEEAIAGWEESVNKHMKGMICKRCGQKIVVPPEGSFTVEGMEKTAEYGQPLPQGFPPSVGGPVFYHGTEAECIAALHAKNKRSDDFICRKCKEENSATWWPTCEWCGEEQE